MTQKSTAESEPWLESEATILEAALELAQLWAIRRSKDPSTKVGAAIYDRASGGLFFGYNGFPHGIEDLAEWWNRKEPEHELLTKYDLVIHAEVNAVQKALKAGVNLEEATLVVTHLPCPECMKNVVVANRIPTVIFATESYSSATARAVWVTRTLAKNSETELIQAKALTGPGKKFQIEED